MLACIFCYVLFQVGEEVLSRQPYVHRANTSPVVTGTNYSGGSVITKSMGLNSNNSQNGYYPDSTNVRQHPIDRHVREILQTDMSDNSLDVDSDNGSRHLGNRSIMLNAQLELYNHTVFRRIWVADVFYISAIAFIPQSSEGSVTVSLNGWHGRIRHNNTIYCCFQGIRRLGIPIQASIVHWDEPVFKKLAASKFVCNLSDTFYDKNKFLPTKIGLSHNPRCAYTQFIDIAYPVPKPNRKKPSFAVCAKIIYGDYDAEKVLEWFEINKAMGVDHVSLFTYNVSKEIKNVLTHYEREGFVTVNDFDFPLKCKYYTHEYVFNKCQYLPLH